MKNSINEKSRTTKPAYQDVRLASQAALRMSLTEPESEHDGEMDENVNLHVQATRIMTASKSISYRCTVNEDIGSHKLSGHGVENGEFESSQHTGTLKCWRDIVLEDIYNR